MTITTALSPETRQKLVHLLIIAREFWHQSVNAFDEDEVGEQQTAAALAEDLINAGLEFALAFALQDAAERRKGRGANQVPTSIH